MPRNLEDLCRLCLHNISRHGCQIEIFDTVDEKQHTLATKIAACLQLPLSISDNLPKHICRACFYKVDSFFKFKTTCIKSETYFNEQINGYKVCDVKIEFCDSDIAYLSSNCVETLDLYNALAQVCQTEENIFPMEIETPSLKCDTQECINNISTTEHSSSNHSLKLDEVQNLKINTHLPLCDQNVQDSISLSEKDLITEDCHVTNEEVSSHSLESKQQTERHQQGAETSETDCSMLAQSTDNQTTNEDILQENKNSTLMCSFCNLEFENCNDVQTHVIETHNIEKSRTNSSMFQELQNSSTFNLNSSLLKLETDKKDKSELVYCECGDTFRNIKVLKKHITRRHLQGSNVDKLAFVCEMCGEKFKSQFLRDYHFSQHFEDLKCKHCSHVSKYRNLIESHERHCYKQNWPFKCPVCEEKFLSLDEMWTHKQVVHMRTEFTSMCNVCNETFKNIKEYNVHKIIHEAVVKVDENLDSVKNEIFICEICEQQFNVKSSIEYHMLVHLAEREKLSIFVRQLSSENG